jgi:predicted Zn-dependent protease
LNNLSLPRRAIALAVIISVLFIVSACGAVLQSVEKDKELGRDTAKQVEAGMGIYQNAKTTQYVDQIGARLVKVNADPTFDYRFGIVDQYIPNAFALPGGYVYVSRGILALTNNEDELAGIVGHEIIHVSRRHSAKQMAKARFPGLLALPGAVVGGMVSESLGNLMLAPVAVMGGAYLASHSRQDEFESDQLGQQLAAQAGYDPSALAVILNRLNAFTEAYTGKKRIPGFFDTHPSTPDRADRVLKDAEKISWQRQQGVVNNAAGHLKQLDGLLVGDDPALGVFQDNDFLHPKLNFFIRFPPDWKALNNPQAVFAVAPKEDGLVVLSLAGQGTDPTQTAEEAIKLLYKKYRFSPSKSEATTIGNLPAHEIIYVDTSGQEPVYMNFLWIAYQDLIYQIISLAPEHYLPLIRETAISFRPLRDKERASIKEARLRVVPARSGESLSQLSARTRNVWDKKTTAIINGLDEEKPLKKGRLIKIAVEQPYQGR